MVVTQKSLYIQPPCMLGNHDQVTVHLFLCYLFKRCAKTEKRSAIAHFSGIGGGGRDPIVANFLGHARQLFPYPDRLPRGGFKIGGN